MYVNAGYLYDSRIPYKDKLSPLTVVSAGTYRLDYGDAPLPTQRPKGRIDYQMLYVSSGVAHFFLDGIDQIVKAGHIVLYRPGEMQKYVYYSEDKPEVFWVHFTGYDVKNILNYYHLTESKRVYSTGTSPEYRRIFQQMIIELQNCRPMYEEMLSSLLNSIFLLINRQLIELPGKKDQMHDIIETSVAYFNEHYNEKINVTEYALSKNVSIGWFTRKFKERTRMTPVQYILSIRISNAQYLLEQSDLRIAEISQKIGYDNQLYFSRIFHKQIGMSPSEYRDFVKKEHPAKE